MQYTWAKSIDDALLGRRGDPMIAQNWLDLRAERGRSNFDQRHLIGMSVQYTTGMGMRGGTLAARLDATLLQEWTFGAQITFGTGSAAHAGLRGCRRGHRRHGNPAP